MNLRQLQAFIAVYRLESLTRAAEYMCITQPAVSVLIRQLEESIGVRLFDRTTRSLYPTETAHESIDRAEQILKEFDELQRSFVDAAHRKRGRLRLGATPAVAASLVAPALLALRRRHPEIDVTIDDVDPEDLIRIVTDKKVELSIGTPHHPSFDVDLTTLIDDTISVICTLDSPLARCEQISWREITAHSTVTVKKGSGIRTIIDNTMRSLGLRFEPIHEVSYLATAMSLTENGLGISILPSYLTRYYNTSRLIAIPLVDPIVKRNLSIITRRNMTLSFAGQRFVEALREQIE